MGRWILFSSLLAAVVFASAMAAQETPREQVQITPPPISKAEIPSPTATSEQLERRGDELRAEKAFLDAIEYYQAALSKNAKSATLYNKLGITHLQLQHFKEAGKDFERAIKLKRDYADAYNNLGVIRYEQKKYGKAIKEYEKAIKLDSTMGSYFSNLGAAYFAKKKFDKANDAYAKALELDPDIFDRISRTGVSAQLSSPEDRAHFNYVLAKLYARIGDTDRSLLCLRRALEEGYKNIDNVYKDTEFAPLRKDPRFAQLMASKPTAIPE
jgi:tetratricopeptide (TPR) repeat protein